MLQYCCIARLQTSRWLNLSNLNCYLQLMLMLLYDCLNLIVSGVKLWTVTGLSQEKGSCEFCTASVGQC